MKAGSVVLTHGKGRREEGETVCSKFEAQIHNGKRLRACDHHPVSVAFKGEEDEVTIKTGKKAWAG